MQRDVLAAPYSHTQLQTFQAVETPHAFAIHQPTLSS
jgi:hypothetical protein